MGEMGYMWDMRLSRQHGLGAAIVAFGFAALWLRADPGDVESSHDYPGIPRMPGFVISDYDEDNPAQFDFPVSRPTAFDASHVEMVHVKGHRYVIRYELAPGSRLSTVFQTQQYFEKVAGSAGYSVQKDGGVGDVTETYYKTDGEHGVWIYLEPSSIANVLTVVEASGSATTKQTQVAAMVPPVSHVPPASPIPDAKGTFYPDSNPMTADINELKKREIALTPPPPTNLDTALAPPAEPSDKAVKSSVPEIQPPPENEARTDTSPLPTPPAASEPAPPEPRPSTDADGKELYQALSSSGRVIVPFVFAPGKDALDDSAQPLIDRIAAMMKAHPELELRVEGHTDNTGGADDNMRLSAQRAINIVNRLSDDDVDKKRLDPVGVGGLQPLADNKTSSGREKNRRIELVTWQKVPAFHAPPAIASRPSSPPPSLSPSALDDDPGFHAPAPNGNNYYPKTTSSQ